MTDNFSHYHITVDRDVFGTTELFEKVTSPASLQLTGTSEGLQVMGMPLADFKEKMVTYFRNLAVHFAFNSTFRGVESKFNLTDHVDDFVMELRKLSYLTTTDLDDQFTAGKFKEGTGPLMIEKFIMHHCTTPAPPMTESMFVSE